MPGVPCHRRALSARRRAEGPPPLSLLPRPARPRPPPPGVSDNCRYPPTSHTTHIPAGLEGRLHPAIHGAGEERHAARGAHVRGRGRLLSRQHGALKSRVAFARPGEHVRGAPRCSRPYRTRKLRLRRRGRRRKRSRRRGRTPRKSCPVRVLFISNQVNMSASLFGKPTA